MAAEFRKHAHTTYWYANHSRDIIDLFHYVPSAANTENDLMPSSLSAERRHSIFDARQGVRATHSRCHVVDTINSLPCIVHTWTEMASNNAGVIKIMQLITTSPSPSPKSQNINLYTQTMISHAYNSCAVWFAVEAFDDETQRRHGLGIMRMPQFTRSLMHCRDDEINIAANFRYIDARNERQGDVCVRIWLQWRGFQSSEAFALQSILFWRSNHGRDGPQYHFLWMKLAKCVDRQCGFDLMQTTHERSTAGFQSSHFQCLFHVRAHKLHSLFSIGSTESKSNQWSKIIFKNEKKDANRWKALEFKILTRSLGKYENGSLNTWKYSHLRFTAVRLPTERIATTYFTYQTMLSRWIFLSLHIRSKSTVNWHIYYGRDDTPFHLCHIPCIWAITMS